MSARMLPHHVGGPTLTVIVGLAVGLGVLTATAGFSPMSAGVVASATGAVGWWAVATEP